MRISQEKHYHFKDKETEVKANEEIFAQSHNNFAGRKDLKLNF